MLISQPRAAFYSILSIWLLSLLSLITISAAAPSTELAPQSDDFTLKPRDSTPKQIKKFLKELKDPPPLDLTETNDPNKYPKGQYLKRESLKAKVSLYKYESLCNGEQILELNGATLRKDRFWEDHDAWVYDVGKSRNEGRKVRARVSKRKEGIWFLQGARLQQSDGSDKMEEVVDYFMDAIDKSGIVIYATPSPKLLSDNSVGGAFGFKLYVELLRTVKDLHKQGIFHNNINRDNVLRSNALFEGDRTIGDRRPDWAKLTNFEVATRQTHKTGFLGSQYYAPIEIVWGKKSWVPREVDMWELGMVGVSLYLGWFRQRNTEAIWKELVQEDKELSQEDAEKILIKWKVDKQAKFHLAKVLCVGRERPSISDYLNDIEEMGERGWADN